MQRTAASIDATEGSRTYDISVVVPTYNRELLLHRTLKSLMSQSAIVRYETIVVDNASDDGTRGVVEALIRQSSDVRYFFEPRRGVSHARNTGTAAARAPIVAFIDDDVEASPSWIATIKQAFDANPAMDCIGGRIVPRWMAPPPSWLTSEFWGAIAIQGPKADTPHVDAEHASPCLMTANFACRRAALEEVGGFAEEYLRDEDRELQLRLWAAGKRGLYVDELVVTAQVPCERLTKRYHRQFFTRAGESHARMQYLERIDKTGRLLRDFPRRATVLATPPYVFRTLFAHAAGLIWTFLTGRWNRAFFHETRLRYFANYIRTRNRVEERSLAELPVDICRVLIPRLTQSIRGTGGRGRGADRPELSKRSLRL
jgi:glycosyltransferase involved in cell wall biosynthesis